MRTCSRLTSLTIMTGLLIIAPVAQSQVLVVDGLSVFAETSFSGNQIDVNITFNVYDVVSEGATGWIVEREVVGNCLENVVVGEVMPLPTEIGEYDFVVTDSPTVNGKHIYYIHGVNEEGTRYIIPWPQRTHFTQADFGTSFAARGTVVGIPGSAWPHLEVCPDECWWALSYWDYSFPDDQDIPPVGSVVGIFGKLVAGMEGPYIDATLWVPASCDVVGTDDLNWGSLKARYW